MQKKVGSKNNLYLVLWVEETGKQGNTVNSREKQQQKAWNEAKAIKHVWTAASREDANYSPVYLTFQIIKELWEGKSSVLGVMRSTKYLGTQVGVVGRQEQFSAFRGGFVPYKNSCGGISRWKEEPEK